MIKIMFVCYGNICRSPMAEFVFRDMIINLGLEDKILVASAATSTEEIGNPVHYGTRNKLAQYGISVKGKQSIQLKKKDYDSYHYLIAMDMNNIRNMSRIIGTDHKDKVFRLLDITNHPRDIADPWYTGDFDRTYEDIKEGCEALIEFIQRKNAKFLSI